MDSNLLVTNGTALLRVLDQEAVKPRAALWVQNPETGTWRLWVVPSKLFTDKREFYRVVSEAISKHQDEIQNMDASDTELVSETHPAIDALSKLFRIPGCGSLTVEGNMLNGFYLPNGIIIRMDISH
jgi:hypothetical protein